MKRYSHTAQNTPALARIKRTLNKVIYASCLGLYNGKGEAAVISYLEQFFRDPASAVALVRG